MKAAVYEQYGPPERVKILDINQPIPNKDEVLIKVIASTVNRTDSGFRSAEYFISRLFSGLLRPKHRVLGCAFAGIVKDTGSEVEEFKIGDRVFGFDDQNFGAHSEYKVIGEKKAISKKPDNISFKEAAPITEGSHYALESIRAAKIKKGDRVLVYGATGAIGSAAIQLLKHFKTHVTAVVNTQNVQLIKSVGVDEVIDYLNEDFTKTDRKYTFIFDAVGKSSFNVCKPLLTKNGIYISNEQGKKSENIWYSIMGLLTWGKKVVFPLPTINKEDVIFLRDLVEKGEFKPIIDREYNLVDIVEAYRYVETGQKTGNVLINI